MDVVTDNLPSEVLWKWNATDLQNEYPTTCETGTICKKIRSNTSLTNKKFPIHLQRLRRRCYTSLPSSIDPISPQSPNLRSVLPLVIAPLKQVYESSSVDNDEHKATPTKEAALVLLGKSNGIRIPTPRLISEGLPILINIENQSVDDKNSSLNHERTVQGIAHSHSDDSSERRPRRRARSTYGVNLSNIRVDFCHPPHPNKRSSLLPRSLSPLFANLQLNASADSQEDGGVGGDCNSDERCVVPESPEAVSSPLMEEELPSPVW